MSLLRRRGSMRAERCIQSGVMGNPGKTYPVHVGCCVSNSDWLRPGDESGCDPSHQFPNKAFRVI